MTKVLLIDTNLPRGAELATALNERGLETTTEETLPSINDLHQYIGLIAPDVLLEASLSEVTSILPTIVTSTKATIPAAVSCIHRGAADYLPQPLEIDQLLAATERAIAAESRNPKQSLHQFPMVGSSPGIKLLKQNISKVAPTESTVLIQGQSGTGKELVARAIHASSNRAHAPLISINCATVPPNLVEAELFGLAQYDTQANNQRGLIDAAEGGTLFLDEIAELPIAAQARLLRVVQGENRRVGASTPHAVNVRVLAATHRSLEQLTASGQFREDLFHRLNVIKLDIPPLRDRHTDVLEIADWLLERTTNRLNKEGITFSEEARRTMLAYHWPGNVRELENAIERAVILSDHNTKISQSALAIEPTVASMSVPDLNADADQTSLEDYFMRFVLDHQDQFTETELAEKLGISRKSLWERRQRLNIPRRKTRKRGPRRDSATQS